MCNMNGMALVLQNVFAERKDWKRALAVGAAGAAGLVVGENEQHVQTALDAPKHFWSGVSSQSEPGSGPARVVEALAPALSTPPSSTGLTEGLKTLASHGMKAAGKHELCASIFHSMSIMRQ